MNRRELFAVGGAGVAGLLFPQKTEAVSVRPVLEGLTDLEMAQKIAEFPQGPEACLEVESQEITKSWGPPPFLRRAWRITLRDNHWCSVRSEWFVSIWDGVVKIHNTVYDSVYDPRMDMIDMSSLKKICIYSKPWYEYSRIAGPNGLGWFTLQNWSE